jgi:hypothetical protein
MLGMLAVSAVLVEPVTNYQAHDWPSARGKRFFAWYARGRSETNSPQLRLPRAAIENG